MCNEGWWNLLNMRTGFHFGTSDLQCSLLVVLHVLHSFLFEDDCEPSDGLPNGTDVRRGGRRKKMMMIWCDDDFFIHALMVSMT